MLIAHDTSHKNITTVFFKITIVMPAQASIHEVKTFSDRLRHARKLRGMTQQALARAGGLSQSAIGSYESGQRQSSRALFKLAAALKVSAVWLDTGRGPMDALEVYRHGPLDQDHLLMESARTGRRAYPSQGFSPAVLSRLEMLTPREKRMLEKMILAFIDACQQEKAKPR